MRLHKLRVVVRARPGGRGKRGLTKNYVQTGDATWVCEVKSLTVENEEKQLRLGLGQVLRYRHLLQAKGEIRAALILERSPTDLSWIELCKRLGVSLAWPGNWSVLS